MRNRTAVMLLGLNLMAAVSLPFVPLAHGATYYVRTHGRDSNAGTSPDTAWRTLTHAASVVVAGDVVHVGGGTYTEDVPILRGGAPRAPVRFLADRQGRMTGDAGEVVIANPSGYALRIQSCAHIQCVGFKIIGQHGVYVHQATDVTLIDFSFYRTTYGVALLDSSVTIQNGSFRRPVRCGVYSVRSKVRILQSTIVESGYYGLLAQEGESSLQQTRILGGGKSAVTAQDATIHIRNCLLTTHGHYGIELHDTKSGSSVWNTTIAGNGKAGIRLRRGTLTVRNSMIASNGNWGLAVEGQGTLDHDYNLVFDHQRDFRGTSQASNEIVQDPQFAAPEQGDYRLRITSPAIDSGKNAAGVVDQDIQGNRRPAGAGWDLGCYESGSSSGPGGWRILHWTEIDRPGA